MHLPLPGLVVAILGLVSGPLALAQDATWLERLHRQDKATQFAAVGRALASGDLRDVAWAGHAAGELQLRAAQAELRATLGRMVEVSGTDGERLLAARALLDALIRLDVPVPQGEIEPWLSGATHDAAFVLLARRPVRHRARLRELLDANDTEDTARRLIYLACGHLLAGQRAPGFARYCLDQLAPRLEIHVYDSDDGMGLGIGGSDGARFGAGRGFAPPDFPPVAIWSLCELPEPTGADAATSTAEGGGRPDADAQVAALRAEHDGFEVIARPLAAPTPNTSRRHCGVGARRELKGPGSFGVGARDKRPRHVVHCREWLRGLAGLEELPFEERNSCWVDVRESDFVTDAVAARDALDQALDHFVARLAARDLLTDEELAGLELRLQVHVSDQRKDQERSLPELPPRRD